MAKFGLAGCAVSCEALVAWAAKVAAEFFGPKSLELAKFGRERLHIPNMVRNI